jgi:hypothetical protein
MPLGLLASTIVWGALGTEREGPVIDFWVAFSEVIITVGRLIREIWSRFRWGVAPGAGRDESPIGEGSYLLYRLIV